MYLKLITEKAYWVGFQPHEKVSSQTVGVPWYEFHFFIAWKEEKKVRSQFANITRFFRHLWYDNRLLQTYTFCCYVYVRNCIKSSMIYFSIMMSCKSCNKKQNAPKKRPVQSSCESMFQSFHLQILTALDI